MSDTSRRGADRACRQSDGMPSFVERLDAIDLATAAGFELPPVMIYEHTWDGRGVDMIEAGKRQAAALARQF